MDAQKLAILLMQLMALIIAQIKDLHGGMVLIILYLLQVATLSLIVTHTYRLCYTQIVILSGQILQVKIHHIQT